MAPNRRWLVAALLLVGFVLAPPSGAVAQCPRGGCRLYLPFARQTREPERFIGLAFPPHSLQTYETDIAAHQRALGVRFALLHVPAVWSEVEFLDLQRLFDIAADNGSTPVIVWEPWSGMRAGVGPNRCQSDYALRRILSGDFDAYIGRFARAAAEWGHGFLLDFGHEMNIDQAAWSGWCNGGADGGPEQFVRTYRYLHDRFAEQGATNVQWVWTPNFQSLPLQPWNDPERYYPGDDYVDWVGTNAFNWGASSSYTEHRFRSVEDIAGPLLDRMARLHPTKMQILLEAGSVDGDGGSRSAWIADGLRAMAHKPKLRAVVYYNYAMPDYLDGQDYDFRLDADAASRSALATAVRDGGYGQTLNEARSARAVQEPRGTGARLGVGLADPGHADAFSNMAGKRHSLVLVFASSASQAASVRYVLDLIRRQGRTALLMWDPTGWRLDEVVAGQHDAQLTQLARYIASVRSTVLVAWGIEPNNSLSGNSWSGAANGAAAGGAERYVAAWRRVHDVFGANGASNVAWVWVPHYQDTMPAEWYGSRPAWRRSPPDWNHFTRYYPGGDYVDWIGVLAVNEGNDVGRGTYWVPPRTFLGPAVTLGARLWPTTPQLVIATSVEDPHDPDRKASWIEGFYDLLQHRPAVRTVVWQNAFRLEWAADSSEASLQAYRAAVGLPYFTSSESFVSSLRTSEPPAAH